MEMNKIAALILIGLLPILLPKQNVPPDFGIVTDLETEEIADKVGELGVRWVRMTIHWDKVELKKGKMDWRVPDGKIARAIERRLKVFVTIHGTPRWANGNKSQEFPPQDGNDWSAFVSAVAARYDRVKAIGLWNEPNLKNFWRGSAEEYVNRILIPGSSAVKAVNPGMLICAPEMSHHWKNEQQWSLSKILQSGAEIDVVTQHVYPDVMRGQDAFGRFLDQYVEPVRGNRPVWITECGMVGCSQKRNFDKQSAYYDQILDSQWKRRGWLQKIFPYRIWDIQDSCEGEHGYGITSGNPIVVKSAFHRYRDFVKRMMWLPE